MRTLHLFPSHRTRKIYIGLTAVLLALLLPGARGEAAAAKKIRTESKSVSSEAGGATVKVSGWATFSGQHMGSVEDAPKDGLPNTEAAEAAGAEAIGSDFIYRPENEDFFWRLELTKIPVLPAGLGGSLGVGIPTTLYGLQFAAKDIAFEIRVQSIPGVDTDNPTESSASVAFGLFKCDTETVCVEVSKLKGGYGTTGERIVVALPLGVLKEKGGVDLKEGDKIAGLGAYIASAPYAVGVSEQGQIHDLLQLIKTADVEIPVKSVTVSVGNKSVTANLKDGYFDAEFPASLFKRSPTIVKTKTCLGKECVNQTFKFTS